MKSSYTLTRAQMAEAFRLWCSDCTKNPDGTLAGARPNDPEGYADILIEYVEKVGA